MAIAEFDCGVPIRLQQCVLDGSDESQGSPVECGSLRDPWVPRGLGALKGLEPLEQVAWALHVEHPSSKQQQSRPELCAALQYELDNTSEEIDEFRSGLIFEVLRAAESMRAEQIAWCIQPLTCAIHGPLLLSLLSRSGFVGAESLVKDCCQGFPLAGDLPLCEGAASPCVFPPADLSVEELRSLRPTLNSRVINAIKELPFSEDIMTETWADSEWGFMTEPRLLEADDLVSKTLTRRLPVREESQRVAHPNCGSRTESGVNPATRPADKIATDILDVLVLIVMFFLDAGIMPQQWKRDISKAFRRVPILAAHLDLAWVVWRALGLLWVSQHRGMPFGTISAVYGWHRVGHALWWLLMILFKAPAAR
jgi:hypothetical protein